jgi:hypothetical protein
LLSLWRRTVSGAVLDFIRPTRRSIGARFKGVPDAHADAFIIVGGIIVLSPRRRNVLSGFERERIRVHEVPILQADRKTSTAHPPHHVPQVAETRRCLVPETS